MADDERAGAPVIGSDLRDLWDDEGTLRVPRRDEEVDDEEVGEFEDDMHRFIEADEDEEENDMGEAERLERTERRRAEREKRRGAGGIKLAGLDQKCVIVMSFVANQLINTQCSRDSIRSVW